ncbi:MAG: hypothetical protein AB1861_11735 [Cyanobacteriota bacterium]
MYITHNLRANLQEWRNRLYNMPPDPCHTLLKSGLNDLFKKAHDKPAIRSILVELDGKANTLSPNSYQEYKHMLEYELENKAYILQFKIFDNDQEKAVHHYHFLKALTEIHPGLFAQFIERSCKQSGDTISHNFVRIYLDPLLDYICDQLNEVNLVLYLLIKYKTRCEWFYDKEIRALYEKPITSEEDGQPVDSAQKPRKRDFREERLNKDLRKFLFDQGIDCAFLDPLSPSGKADVVALLDSQDPLVLEIKIFDRNKNYRKERIIDGFRQIVSYSNDYNKPIGYLLVFNMDKAELDFVTQHNDDRLPTQVIFAGKTYFIIVVNLPLFSESASKRGRVKKITIREEELTSTEL